MPRGKPTLGERARPTAQHRARVARARAGKKHSPETRAKISAALKGRPKTPEHRAAAAEARRAAAEKTVAERAAETADRRRRRWGKMRFRQWHLDRLKALQAGDMELYQDVKRSYGWRWKRKIFRLWAERRVSCGFSGWRGEILWDPAIQWRSSGTPGICNYALVDGEGWKAHG
jgi:hypothetical protein